MRSDSPNESDSEGSRTAKTLGTTNGDDNNEREPDVDERRDHIEENQLKGAIDRRAAIKDAQDLACLAAEVECKG